MSRAAIEALLYVLDEAFSGNVEHSLMGNLKAVTAADWDWRPAGSGRSIREIALHAGTAKYVYDDFAFRAGRRSWAEASEHAVSSIIDLADARSWLAEGHKRLRESIAALRDSDLEGPRRTHYGIPESTRFIIAVVIQHDLYHAGEINHLRALRQETDYWPGQSPL